MPPANKIPNPYWDAVKDHTEDHRWWGLTVKDYYRGDGPERRPLVNAHSFTIPDPASLQFVLDHCGASVVDPIAGTAYWVHLLRHSGRKAIAYDLCPPSTGENTYHRAAAEWVTVIRADALAAVKKHEAETLLLSWPPYDTSIGEDIVRAYDGKRLIYMGETEGGCCGGDGLFDLLENEWDLVAEHRPVQWQGIHDLIRVYDRAPRSWVAETIRRLSEIPPEAVARREATARRDPEDPFRVNTIA